jgi:hypothetical protein
MSFTSSKLRKQERIADSRRGTTVQQLSEPVAGGGHGMEVSVKLPRDAKRIERLRRHSSVAMHRVEMGMEAMRSDISGSSLVDAQVSNPVTAKALS